MNGLFGIFMAYVWIYGLFMAYLWIINIIFGLLIFVFVKNSLKNKIDYLVKEEKKKSK